MNGREFWELSQLSSDELEASLGALLGAGARVEARVVAHLAEVEARRLHLLAGCSSLYDYCRKRLGLSDYEAFVRIAAARVARKYPLVFGMLERRELHLTAICEAREYLSAENHRELLQAVAGKTKLQIREVLAERFPQADVPAKLKKLPALEPLSPGRYRLVLTLSAEQKEKLELARDLLSHANRSGDLAVVVERALDELIARLETRRLGKKRSSVPREPTRAPTCPLNGGETPTAETLAAEVDTGPARAEGAIASAVVPDLQQPAVEPAVGATRRRKHIAHEVRRQLLARDGLQCTFIGEGGERCDARAFLQLHHRLPWACGGADHADNLELLCHAHNRLLAERDFGKARVDELISQRSATRPPRGI